MPGGKKVVHHCPGANGPVSGYPGNCSIVDHPVHHCQTHQNYCVEHDWNYMKTKAGSLPVGCVMCENKKHYNLRDQGKKKDDDKEDDDDPPADNKKKNKVKGKQAKKETKKGTKKGSNAGVKKTKSPKQEASKKKKASSVISKSLTWMLEGKFSKTAGGGVTVKFTPTEWESIRGRLSEEDLSELDDVLPNLDELLN